MSDAPETPAAPPEAIDPPRRPDYRPLVIVLAGALLLVVALVASAPLWVSQLPWAAAPGTAFEERIARLEAAERQRRSDEAAAAAARQSLDKRVIALETKPAAPPPPELGELRQQVAKLAATTGELSSRVDVVDRAVRAQSGPEAADVALALALLQIRDAVEFGRPFEAAFDSFAALARARPEIAAAAAPLAGPAKSGLATRAVLAKRLHELAPAIAATPPSAPEAAAGEIADWTDAALARLRRLVTIRRLDEGAPPLPAAAGPGVAAVGAAEGELAGGDLDGAVAALDKLTGVPAEAAGPWLRMARQRLAVEAALQRVEAQLAARLGAAASGSR